MYAGYISLKTVTVLRRKRKKGIHWFPEENKCCEQTNLSQQKIKLIIHLCVI